MLEMLSLQLFWEELLNTQSPNSIPVLVHFLSPQNTTKYKLTKLARSAQHAKAMRAKPQMHLILTKLCDG